MSKLKPTHAAATPPIVANAGKDEFDAYGEKLGRMLDLDTWVPGEDLMSAYGRLEEEVGRAAAAESEITKRVRAVVFDQLATISDLSGGKAGLCEADINTLRDIHNGLLFNGGVEACDGTCVVHDTIPLTITQIGVCLVSYNGAQASWMNRLFRRDLRERINDPVNEVMAVLNRREKREAQGFSNEPMSELARRGIMAYAERAVLKEKSKATWRMGHGNPAPYELLTGKWASHEEAIRRSLSLIRWYVEDHKRFLFVPSAPRERHYLTIGGALRPREYAILSSLEPSIGEMIDKGGYRESSGVRPLMEAFRREVAPKIAVGLYRASLASPAYLFYSHVDHVDMAAHIAIADSLLQEHRGFPMLIDLADKVCRSTFDPEGFKTSTQSAYAAAGHPFRYLGERETR